MAPVSTLADAVLPLIRTRSDLYRYSAANAHGRDMHEAVDILEAAIPTTDPAEIYAVTHKALASSLKVIARADDSSGIIGDACRRLLELHPQAAEAARTPVGKLIDWMMKFQFDEEVDYFELDALAYAPALGEVGMAAYRKRLAEVETRLGPQPSAEDRWTSGHAHEWFTLDWNAQRLAILDHDIEAIIRTHARDRKVAAWFENTAEAFEEICEIDLASTGRSRPPTSTADTSHSRPRTTGADSSSNTDPPTRSKRGWWCSDAGRPRPRPPGCTWPPPRHGPSTATRSWRPSRRAPTTPCCSRSSP